MDTPTTLREILFTLLLKVGVASSIAALLARWNTFRRVLFTEERDADQKLKLMLFMAPPLIVGVTLRLVSPAYRFADLSLEGAFLMGLLGGRVVGPVGGAIITIPALIAVLILIVQIALGAFTVELELTPILVTAHLGTALALFATTVLVAAAARWATEPGRRFRIDGYAAFAHTCGNSPAQAM